MNSTNSLQWRNLNLIHKKTNKSILTNLKGKINCGQFLTIMGQSGAGKSSLLSILTARTTTRTSGFILEGQVLMNGQKYDSMKFAKCAAYVRQDDILLGTLTVEETFQFQARLKLHQQSEVKQQYKINQIIKQLNLQQCKKTLVGGQFRKSISGGQRKRVAIGVELLADPSCLVLDEPTSGLDSNNSTKIIRILKSLAKDGRVIIATIHQPSSLMFIQMNKLLLLGKGQTLFFGFAKEIVPYMSQMGIQVNSKMNPADFFMLEVSQYKNSESYKTPVTADNFQKYCLSLKKQQQSQTTLQNNSPTKNQVLRRRSEVTQAHIFKQFPILFKRSFKNFFRTPTNFYGKIFNLFIIPIFMGTIYYKVGSQYPESPQQLQQYLLKICSFFFLFTLFNFSTVIYDTTLAFPPQKQLVLKQTSANLYSLSTYYFCRCTVQIPITVIVSIITTSSVYFLSFLEPQIQHFVKFVLVTTLLAICGYMFGSLVGIVFSTAQHAVQILPLLIIPFFMYGGLVVNIKSIPQYSRWAQYLSPIRHAYFSIILDQMQTSKMHDIINNPQIKGFFGVSGTFWQSLVYLGLQFIFCSVASLATMYIKRKPI